MAAAPSPLSQTATESESVSILDDSQTLSPSILTASNKSTSSSTLDDLNVAAEEEDEQLFGDSKSHLEFIKMLRATKKMADHTNSKVPLQWRGYKSSVFPSLPPFTVKDLKDRLKLALKGVFNMSGEERKV